MSSVLSHTGLIFSTVFIRSVLKWIVLAKPGFRVMLVKFSCCLFPGISISFLKDTYGSFLGAIEVSKLILVASVQPVDDFLAKFIPL